MPRPTDELIAEALRDLPDYVKLARDDEAAGDFEEAARSISAAEELAKNLVEAFNDWGWKVDAKITGAGN